MSLNGYSSFFFNRPRADKATRDHGGLAIFIKNTIRPGVKLKPASQSDYQWVYLDKSFFNFSKNVYICFVHDAPDYTGYSRRKAIETLQLLQRDILNFRESGEIVLAGDFNARTTNVSDFINDDSSSFTPLHDDYREDCIIRPRSSEDECHRPCTRGRTLLDLCISSQLGILNMLNGRMLDDPLGKVTYHGPLGSSVIDYVIASENIYENILYFKVHDFKRAFSDHCKISFKLLASYNVSEQLADSTYAMPESLPFKARDITKYQSAFNLPPIKEKVTNFLNEDWDKTQEGVERATTQLNEIILIAAKLSLKARGRRHCKHKNKKWFDASLEQSKRDSKQS